MVYSSYLCYYYSGRKHRVIKCSPCVYFILFFIFFNFRIKLSRLRSTVLITPLICTRKMVDACLVCLYKRHNAVESPSHVHRSSANSKCTQMNYEMNCITIHRCKEMYCNVLQTARVHWRVPVLFHFT